MDEMHLTNEVWTEIDDLGALVKRLCGTAVIEAIFGKELLKINPDFVDNLWRLDNDLPWFARGLPSFVIPRAYRNRRGLVDQILRWYEYARQNFDESMIDADGDGDPVWGSAMVRNRQDEIPRVANQDDESLATLDLGLAWA
jgi:hypothetical protein